MSQHRLQTQTANRSFVHSGYPNSSACKKTVQLGGADEGPVRIMGGFTSPGSLLNTWKRRMDSHTQNNKNTAAKDTQVQVQKTNNISPYEKCYK